MRVFILILLVFFTYSCENKKIHNCLNNINYNSKVFKCNDKNIKDFSFLTKYKNLEALDLTGTSVNDLSFLSKLNNLKVLLLIDTKVTDISEIKKLKDLRELYLSKTNVSDISVLKNLKKLEILHVDNTRIINIDVLKKINLKQLSLDNLFADEYENNIYEYSNIIDIINYYTTCKKLEAMKGSQLFKDNCSMDCNIVKYLSINKNNLRNYPDLLVSLYHKYNNINYLNLFGMTYNYSQTLLLNNISSLTLYKNTLKKLKLHLKSSKYLNTLSKLNKLEELHLSGNIENIIELPEKLKSLSIYNANISNFNFLKKSNLKSFRLITPNIDKYKFLINKYPHIKIDILDSLYFSPIIEYDNYKKIIGSNDCSIKIKGFWNNGNIDNSTIYYDKKIINNKFMDAYAIPKTENEENIIRILQKGLIPENFYYMKYAIEELKYDVNKLNHNSLSILDRILSSKQYNNNLDKNIKILEEKYNKKKYKFLLRHIENLKRKKEYPKIINSELQYLKKHGAKRGCEILKTKCEPLSPEIEKILKNNNKK